MFKTMSFGFLLAIASISCGKSDSSTNSGELILPNADDLKFINSLGSEALSSLSDNQKSRAITIIKEFLAKQDYKTYLENMFVGYESLYLPTLCEETRELSKQRLSSLNNEQMQKEMSDNQTVTALSQFSPKDLINGFIKNSKNFAALTQLDCGADVETARKAQAEKLSKGEEEATGALGLKGLMRKTKAFLAAWPQP